jgi:hypothetical protein
MTETGRAAQLILGALRENKMKVEERKLRREANRAKVPCSITTLLINPLLIEYGEGEVASETLSAENLNVLGNIYSRARKVDPDWIRPKEFPINRQASRKTRELMSQLKTNTPGPEGEKEESVVEKTIEENSTYPPSGIDYQTTAKEKYSDIDEMLGKIRAIVVGEKDIVEAAVADSERYRSALGTILQKLQGICHDLEGVLCAPPLEEENSLSHLGKAVEDLCHKEEPFDLGPFGCRPGGTAT